jgi:hypothetical protein
VVEAFLVALLVAIKTVVLVEALMPVQETEMAATRTALLKAMFLPLHGGREAVCSMGCTGAVGSSGGGDCKFVELGCRRR